MNSKTQELTYGAMMTAILAVLMLFNRQTGMFFEEVLLFVYPLPMVIFTAKYGIKDSIPVWVSMTALAFLIGAFTNMFYGGCAVLTGIILGGCLKSRRSARTTMIAVMAISSVESIITTVVLATLFGYDIKRELAQLRQMIDKMLDTYRQQILASGAGDQALEAVNRMAYYFSDSSLKRFYIISMILIGVIQGLVIYYISILVLRKLKYQVPKPTPLAEYYPPKWTGFAGLLLFLLMSYTFTRTDIPEIWVNVMQTIGILGMMYLVFWGYIALLLFFRTKTQLPKALTAILSILLTFFLSTYVGLLGFMYIASSLHDYLLKK